MDSDLGVGFISHPERSINCRGCRAPILMQLQAACPGCNLLNQRRLLRIISFAKQTKVEREFIQRLKHAMDIPRPGSAGSSVRAICRPGAAAYHGGSSAADCFYCLLRRDKVYVSIDCSSRAYSVLASNDFGGRRNDHLVVDSIHYVRVAGLANSGYQTVFNANVSLDYAQHRIHDYCVCDNQVKGIFARYPTCLTHPVSDTLPAAKDQLVAIGQQILFDLDYEVSISQPDSVANSRPIEFGVLLSWDLEHC